MRSDFKLNYKFTRKIWKKLHDSSIPIISKEELQPQQVRSSLERLNYTLKSSQYFPNTGHGFLGINKNFGVTRFIPILSADDMAVYYYICYLLSEKILEKREGIYGGWQIIPHVQKKSKDELSIEEIEGYLQDYFSDSISKKSWWKEWNQYVEMISELTTNKNIGNFVLTSDIANFYDSISTDKLLRKLRVKTSEFNEHIDVLEVFLSYWNRRITGYTPTTKGIPQELFSDASRVLSHFYLQYFDKKFKDICNSNNITYARWADDILLFGASKKTLEECLHKASKILLADGLYLSAGKTKIMTRTEFGKYRCVSFLNTVHSDDLVKFEKSLRNHKKSFDQGIIRSDTLLKTTIGHAAKHHKSISSYVKLFIDEAILNNVELSLTLNDQQIFKAILLNPNPKDLYFVFEKRILKKPYASSRATFLLMLRKRKFDLENIGITIKIQLTSIKRIEKASSDSEILQKICIPITKNSY